MTRPGLLGSQAGPATTDAGQESSEQGQVTVLIIGYILISLLVITVVLGASSLYIGHKKLLSAADGAALAAADNYSIDIGGIGTGAPLPILRDTDVEESVAGYLASTGAADRFDRLAIDAATGAPDGRTARVVLTAVVRPPIVNFLVPAGIPITAQADARAQLVR
ncbi:pilus assembly protein TadG-related protein [Arthrobacter agilis]|uniref:pilus assembly protein TadG-related protein n=1 Tax=Arthrobacter agilis TaxID=37921 RepID=UPI0023651B76|nr:pilus assembly protein TadG-related protein [Arthrobacter agilis]WDF32384.1 pilus assembly protein TadG-related protein [Arthrobacter agilis]